MKKILFLLMLVTFASQSQTKVFPLLEDTLTDKKALIIEAANLKHIVRVSDNEVAQIVGEFYHTIAHWPEPIAFENKLLQLQAVRKIYTQRSEIGYIKNHVIYINANLLKEYPNTGRAALLHLLAGWQGMEPLPMKFKYNQWSEDLYSKRREHRTDIKNIMKRLSEEKPVNYKLF